MTRPVCVIIRDGWGINENPEGNAVHAAATPNIDKYKKEYPWTTLECSGEPVGLPDTEKVSASPSGSDADKLSVKVAPSATV